MSGGAAGAVSRVCPQTELCPTGPRAGGRLFVPYLNEDSPVKIIRGEGRVFRLSVCESVRVCMSVVFFFTVTYFFFHNMSNQRFKKQWYPSRRAPWFQGSGHAGPVPAQRPPHAHGRPHRHSGQKAARPTPGAFSLPWATVFFFFNKEPYVFKKKKKFEL